MDSFVVALTAVRGRPVFYAPRHQPPWTSNVHAAGQYLRREDAEADARLAVGVVVPWHQALDVLAGRARLPDVEIVRPRLSVGTPAQV